MKISSFQRSSRKGSFVLRGDVIRTASFRHHAHIGSELLIFLIYEKKKKKTHLCGIVVSTSECRLEGRGFESHQSDMGFFKADGLLPRVRMATGTMERLAPHSRASLTSWTVSKSPALTA